MQEKIIAAIPPAIPMYRVFYDPKLDEIFTQPIIALAFIEEIVEEGDTMIEGEHPGTTYFGCKPIAFDPGGDFDSEEEDNCVGYSLGPSPSKRGYQYMIDSFKRREKERKDKWKREANKKKTEKEKK